MANIKSQIKRNKQNEKARQRNKAVKSSTEDRRVASSARRPSLAPQERRPWPCARRRRGLDKAASKGVIHKNQAANRKSAIARRYAELSNS